MTAPPPPRMRRRPRRRSAQQGVLSRPVTWWIVFAALSTLALPALARGQGLQSTTMSVTLVAVRPPDPLPVVRELSLDVGPLPPDATTRLALEGPDDDPVYVRARGGRLQRLGRDAMGGVAVQGQRLELRALIPAGMSRRGTRRTLILTVQTGGHVEYRRLAIDLP